MFGGQVDFQLYSSGLSYQVLDTDDLEKSRGGETENYHFVGQYYDGTCVGKSWFSP